MIIEVSRLVSLGFIGLALAAGVFYFAGVINNIVCGEIVCPIINKNYFTYTCIINIMWFLKVSKWTLGHNIIGY